MASNMQMNNWGGQFGGGGGMQNLQNMGGMGGMPSFSQYQGWSNQMGRPQQQPQAPPGQNGPVDSNAPYRNVYGPNGALANGGTLGSPYGMNQSNTNTWNGNGWSSNQGTPVPSSQLGGYMNRPPRGQSERPQQQWNPGPNTGMQTPYQMPGGQGPISMDPRSGGMRTQPGGVDPNIDPNHSPWVKSNWNGTQLGGQPRPQSPPMAPGQQQYNGPAIVPMNNQPGRGIGPGGPTRNVPGFNPNGFRGIPAPQPGMPGMPPTWKPQTQNPQQQGPYRTF